MTPDYWTLTITQHLHGRVFERVFDTTVTEDVYTPVDREVIIDAAERLDQKLLHIDGVLLTDRTRTCTRGYINE